MNTPRIPSPNIRKLLNHLRAAGALGLMTQLQDEIYELEMERQQLCDALELMIVADRSNWADRKDQAVEILKTQGWSCPTT